MSSTSTLFANAATPRTALLGEIVSWDFGKVSTNLTDLRAAVDAAGLPANDYCPVIKPRNAFARAMRDLQVERIVRKVDESSTAMRFQFTQESRNGDGIDYSREAILTLDKATGSVACPERPDLATAAQDKIAEKIVLRTGNDLHRITTEVLKTAGDLYAIRQQGGCYFVPADHMGVSDQVAAVADSLGGSYQRFPVPKGFGAEGSVKDTVASGLAGLLAEYDAAAEDFDPLVNTDLKLRNAVKRLEAAKIRIEGYKELLSDATAGLLATQAEITEKVKAKLAALSGFVASERGTAGEAETEDAEAVAAA